jgi:hemerythrin
MRERHYDEYEDHKADHERLLDEMRDLMDRYEDHADFDQESFAEQLRQWFVVHFKTKDPRLRTGSSADSAPSELPPALRCSSAQGCG